MKFQINPICSPITSAFRILQHLDLHKIFEDFAVNCPLCNQLKYVYQPGTIRCAEKGIILTIHENPAVNSVLMFTA